MGKGSSAPSGYQPTWQAGADNNFQQLQSQVSNTGSALASFAPGAYGSIYNSTVNNPYYSQAQSGADTASAIGAGYVAPAQFGAASTLLNAGDTAAAGAPLQYGIDVNQGYADRALASQAMSTYGASPKYMGRAQADAGQLYGAIPAATAGYGLATPGYQQTSANANQLYGLDLAGLGMIPGMTSAAQGVLGAGFDPQNALYDRNYQQMMEQTNAINAQQGVSGSPFAAGVAGQNASNFNIDWNAQQLQNKINALNAYTNTMGTAGSLANNFINGAASNYGGLMNDATSNFNNLTNSATSNLNTLVGSADSMLQTAKAQQFADWQASMNNATSRYNTLAGLGNQDQQLGINAYDTLSRNAMSDYAGASDLGAAGLNTMTTSAMYPNEVYMNNQSQILQALNSLVSGTTGALAPDQSAITNDLNYLKTGQSATQNAQNAWQMNQAANSSFLSGLGGIAGMALAPFTGGMSLMGEGGLLGAGGGLSALLGGNLGIGNSLNPSSLAGSISPLPVIA